MSVKARIVVGAATFGLVAGGLGMVGPLTAGAATPTCGGNCASIFSQKYGPGYLLGVGQPQAAAGVPIILSPRSAADPGEDFGVRDYGTVGAFYTTHDLGTPEFAHAYSGDQAYEIQYEPYGVNSNYCVSTAPGQSPQPGDGVQLEQCLTYSNSIWAADGSNVTDDCHSTGSELAPSLDDVPLINGADDEFSNPLVLSDPAGDPAGTPSPQLNVQPEHTYSGNTVFDTQEWGTSTGPVVGRGVLCPTPTPTPTPSG